MNGQFDLRSLERLRPIFACLVLLLISACSTTTPSKNSKDHPPNGTVLWAVRFANEMNPDILPTTLAVLVEDQSKTRGGQFAFRAHQTTPRAFSEFMVHLNLPPGSYRITRVFGTAGEGSRISQFDFSTQMTIEVKNRESHYLGRIEITNRARGNNNAPATAPAPASGVGDAARFSSGTPWVTANNEVKDDLVTVHKLWPELRGTPIKTVLPERLTVLSGAGNASNIDARFPANGAPSGEYLKGKVLDAQSAQDLAPVPKAAFTKFVRAALPRAFAVGPGTAFGSATSTQDAIPRALAECKGRRALSSKDQPCRLYAVDNTIMSGVSAGPASRQRDIGTSPQPKLQVIDKDGALPGSNPRRLASLSR